MVSFFIRKGVVTICLNVAILLVGALSLKGLAREFIPSIEIPAVAVIFPITVNRPEIFAEQFLAPLERALLLSNRVDRVESTIQGGRSITLVYFKWDLTPEESLQRARQITNGFQRPPGVLDPIFVLHRPSLSPVYRVVFHGTSAPELTRFTDPVVRDLERVPGVAEVRRLGAATEVTTLEVAPLEAASAKTSLQEIVRAASEEWSFRQLWPSDESGPSTIVKVRIRGSQKDDQKNDQKNDPGVPLSSMMVRGSSGVKLELRQMAKINEGTLPPTVFFGKGEDGLILEILKAPGADTVRMLETAKSRIAAVLSSRPDLQATVIYDEANEIVQSQSGVLSNFSQGILLNSVILVLFLGTFRGVFIASAIFPTAVVGTLFLMKQLDVSLNIFSLNGFSLAAGMITDASTVVLESVLRRIQKGDDIRDGTIRGTSDVMVGVISGTAASAAVLIPICLQTGVSAKLFSDLGIALIGTQVLTLISVFSLVPYLCSRMLKPDMTPKGPIRYAFNLSSALVDRVSGVAIQSLAKTKSSRALRFGLPAVFTFCCLGSFAFLPNSELLPTVQSPIYLLTIPMGRSQLQARGDSLLQKLSQTIGSRSEFSWVIASRDEDSLNGTLSLKPGEAGDFKALKQELAKALGVGENGVHFFPLGPTPPSESMNFDGSLGLSHKLSAEKRAALTKRICAIPGVIDCVSHEHYSGPSVTLDADSISIQRAHTNPLSTAIEMSLMVNSVDLRSVANLDLKSPLVLASQKHSFIPESPFLANTMASAVAPLISIGSLYRESVEFASQVRFAANLDQYDPLYFKIGGLTIGQVAGEIELVRKDLGATSADLRVMGSMANMDETFSKIQFALMISLLLNFGILLLQFRSVVQTVLIMLTIPLALGGSVVGLILMNETVNVGVLVGFMLLGGIVVNNGILLLESYGQAREQGADFDLAMSEAIRTRTRPILMTAFSTIFGMMPTLLDSGSGAELYRGMAIVNIFGMALGTVLSLMVLPVLCRLTLARRV